MEYLLHVFTLVSEAYLLEAWTNTALWVPYLFLYSCHYIRAASSLGKQTLSMCLSESNCMGHWLLCTILIPVLKGKDDWPRHDHLPYPFLFLYFLPIFTSLKKPHFLEVAQYRLRIIELLPQNKWAAWHILAKKPPWCTASILKTKF